MHERYRDRASFYVVYIEEAHPTNLWQVSSNVQEGVEFASPQSAAERADIAAACVLRLAVKIPSLLDGMGNDVERAYTAWPDRLYIVDTDRRIRFKSAPGPFGFSTTELEDALVRVLH
jgi:type I thyroxine 5'-deiodinase